MQNRQAGKHREVATKPGRSKRIRRLRRDSCVKATTDRQTDKQTDALRGEARKERSGEGNEDDETQKERGVMSGGHDR